MALLLLCSTAIQANSPPPNKIRCLQLPCVLLPLLCSTSTSLPLCAIVYLLLLNPPSALHTQHIPIFSITTTALSCPCPSAFHNHGTFRPPARAFHFLAISALCPSPGQSSNFRIANPPRPLLVSPSPPTASPNSTSSS